jgi:hypothetical protein
VRGEIVLADVRLELDDPADPPSRAVVADEVPAEECPPGLERRQVEDGPRLPQAGRVGVDERSVYSGRTVT